MEDLNKLSLVPKRTSIPVVSLLILKLSILLDLTSRVQFGITRDKLRPSLLIQLTLMLLVNLELVKTQRIITL